MIAIDSSAVVAVLRMEPEAQPFLRRIAASPGSVMSAFSYLETSLVIPGRTGTHALADMIDDFLAEAGITVVPLDREQAECARIAFARFGKGRHGAGLNIGDCASYALAKTRNLPLLYKGDDFAQTDLPAA